MSDAPTKSSVTIKKYANRRLYNTATSSYVTLDDLSKMVKEGVEFNVYDAKTSEDITRPVLTQIIVEEEGKTEQTLLPISFLRQLIGFYGDNMQWLVPKYLEHSMGSLAKNQEQLRSYFQNTFGSMFPFGSTLEEMGKQNMAMFERAMKMFNPFGNMPGMPMGMPGMTMPGMPMSPTSSPASSSSVRSESSSSPSSSSSASSSSASSASASKAAAMAEEQEEAAEAAFTPSSSIMPISSQQSSLMSGDDVQNKIAQLQQQLANLAKK